MKFIQPLSFLIIITCLFACDSGPKVIEAEPAAPEQTANKNDQKDNGSVFMDVPNPGNSSGEHRVTVEEILNTEKYSYLYVAEGEKKFWVAISKRPIDIGATYYYKGGLLKRNFYSKEHDRVFETVYLVSDIRKQPITGSGGSGSAVDQALNRINGNTATGVDVSANDIAPVEGAIKLAELFADKAKFNGKTIVVTGKCVKVNPMIMGRNWIHIQDGSGEEFDLTITTTENIPLGHVVSLEGTIALDKDFGAGYRYDIIMEGAVLK
ncbi:MAG: hypothetical protein AAFZ15_01245 [Bacteroidota bacterium]